MRYILLVLAAVIAIVVGIAINQYLSKNAASNAPVASTARTSEQQVTTVDVLVAKEPIEIGTVVTAAMVDVQPWPENLVVDGFIVNNDKNNGVVGKVARGAFEAHEPFIASKLANPNDPSYFAAHLPAGMRAVTLASDAIAGVAGYVFPGDRVDVVFTHNLPKELYEEQQAAIPGNNNLPKTASDKPGVAEVLAANVRVLAINLRQPSTKEQSQPSTAPSSVTVEMSESDVQKLRLAEKNGTLSLALRSLKDEKNNDVPAPTLVETISSVQVQKPKGAETIKIVRGVSKDSDVQLGGQGTAAAMQPQAPQLNATSGAMPDMRRQ